jgi:hypothetical protein
VRLAIDEICKFLKAQAALDRENAVATGGRVRRRSLLNSMSKGLMGWD